MFLLLLAQVLHHRTRFSRTAKEVCCLYCHGSTQHSNIHSSSHLCSSRIGRTLTQALCYMTTLCNVAQMEKSVSLLIHALQVTHHMKHDLKSTTFCHCFFPAELLDKLKFLMISKICNGRKKNRDSLLLLKTPGCSSRKKDPLMPYTNSPGRSCPVYSVVCVRLLGVGVSQFFKFSHFCLQITKYHFLDSLW